MVCLVVNVAIVATQNMGKIASSPLSKVKDFLRYVLFVLVVKRRRRYFRYCFSMVVCVWGGGGDGDEYICYIRCLYYGDYSAVSASIVYTTEPDFPDFCFPFC